MYCIGTQAKYKDVKIHTEKTHKINLGISKYLSYRSNTKDIMGLSKHKLILHLNFGLCFLLQNLIYIWIILI